MLDEINERIVKQALDSGPGGGLQSLAYLIGMTERSEHLAESSLRRATIHLFAGVTFAIIGILIFVSTVSDDVDRYEACSMHLDAGSCLAPLVVLSLRRLAVLAFIEVLAGFFLKYYRIAMEEHRYFETIARRREASATAFLIHQDFKGDDVLLALSKELMKVPGIGVLGQGETTRILEAGKISENDFLTLIGFLADFAKEFKAKLVAQSEPKARPGDKSPDRNPPGSASS